MLTERLVPESSANLVAALADLHCNELAPHRKQPAQGLLSQGSAAPYRDPYCLALVRSEPEVWQTILVES
jgi:hypothetical protein